MNKLVYNEYTTKMLKIIIRENEHESTNRFGGIADGLSWW